MRDAPGRATRLSSALLPALLVLAPGRLGGAPAPAAPPAVETVAESIRPKGVVSSPHGMVVTSSPEASWAGVRMLEAGGNAVDAAVAAAFVLTAADPGGSGIGGQSWMVLGLASGEERAISCPARSPMRIDLARARAARWDSELWGPMAATVPTTVATLSYALSRYGTMELSEVLGPAIEAAEGGYRTQSFEHDYLASYARRLFDSEVLCPVYLTGPKDESGYPSPGPVGTCVKIPGLAGTFRRLAEAGASDFYTGAIARDLDAAMRDAGGFVRMTDLMRVPAQVEDVPAVRGSYRDLEVLSVPRPAGGSVLVMALQILDALGPERTAAPGLSRGHAIVEAVRLARAGAAIHRNQGEIAEGPLRSEWLTKKWAARQAARIPPDRALSATELEEEAEIVPWDRGTSHISVVDAKGNAVSLTQSLGRYYGAAWAAPKLGFLLNAFLEPFDAADPDAAGYLRPGVAVPAPVAPFLLQREGRTVLVAGTAGSSRIPSILVNLVVGLVDGNEAPVEAFARPRILWENDSAGPRVMIEIAPPLTRDAVPALTKMGYANVFALTAPGGDTTIFGGIHAVHWDPATSAWLAVLDGRRPSVAAAPSRIAAPAR